MDFASRFSAFQFTQVHIVRYDNVHLFDSIISHLLMKTNLSDVRALATTRDRCDKQIKFKNCIQFYPITRTRNKKKSDRSEPRICETWGMRANGERRVKHPDVILNNSRAYRRYRNFNCILQAIRWRALICIPAKSRIRSTRNERAKRIEKRASRGSSRFSTIGPNSRLMKDFRV